MGEETKIAWTDHTFNPWIGCTRKHTGCENCYAETQNAFRKWNGPGTWGPKAPRRVTSKANWNKPLRWAKEASAAGVRRRVFCASLADVLDEQAPREAQAKLWDLIRTTARPFTIAEKGGGLDWLLLTKRPERWSLIPEDVRPLVWFGTSIADQKTAAIWGRRLLEARGFRYRFFSLEPMVGPVVLGPELAGAVDWVIIGGESGGGARPFNLRWAREVVSECKAHRVPVFVKQLGRIPIADERQVFAFDDYRALEARTDRTHGGKLEEFPEDLRIQELPCR